MYCLSFKTEAGEDASIKYFLESDSPDIPEGARPVNIGSGQARLLYEGPEPERFVWMKDVTAEDIVEFHRSLLEEDRLDDVEVAVVSYGIAARTAFWPMQLAREEGIRVGMLRLVTVWPFPEEQIRDLAGRVNGIVVPEINMGQIVREVERCAAGQTQVLSVPHPGGGIHDPQAVLGAIRKAAGR